MLLGLDLGSCGQLSGGFGFKFFSFKPQGVFKIFACEVIFILKQGEGKLVFDIIGILVHEAGSVTVLYGDYWPYESSLPGQVLSQNVKVMVPEPVSKPSHVLSGLEDDPLDAVAQIRILG